MNEQETCLYRLEAGVDEFNFSYQPQPSLQACLPISYQFLRAKGTMIRDHLSEKEIRFGPHHYFFEVNATGVKLLRVEEVRAVQVFP